MKSSTKTMTTEGEKGNEILKGEERECKVSNESKAPVFIDN